MLDAQLFLRAQLLPRTQHTHLNCKSCFFDLTSRKRQHCQLRTN